MNNKPKKLKWAFIVLFLILVLLLFFKYLSGENEEAPKDRQEQALTITSHSKGFQDSFKLLLDHYEKLLQSLAQSDSTAANKAAHLLLKSADSLDLNDFNSDTTGAIQSLAADLRGSISAESQGLISETSLEQKRRALELISDQIWNLARALHYEMEQLYYYQTSKAFNGQGAYWISRGKMENDPFTGEPILSNSVLTDSLRFDK
jgi:hypothetical protein